MAPTHLTSAALFKYFADGHFGFDGDSTGNSRKGGIFKKHTLKESDLLKFGRKAVKLPLHRALWAKYAEEAPGTATGSSKLKHATADAYAAGSHRRAGPSAAALKAMRKQQGAIENFKNVMRYMGDMPLHRRHGVAAGHHSAASDIMDNLERDALRSKVIQLGLTHHAASLKPVSTAYARKPVAAGRPVFEITTRAKRSGSAETTLSPTSPPQSWPKKVAF